MARIRIGAEERLLRRPDACVVFATGVWWVFALVGIFVVRWDALHTLIAGFFALRMIKVAQQADADRALQEKVKGRSDRQVRG